MVRPAARILSLLLGPAAAASLLLLLLTGVAWVASRKTALVISEAIWPVTVETTVWHGSICRYAPDDIPPNENRTDSIYAETDWEPPAGLPAEAPASVAGFASVHVTVPGPEPWSGRATFVPLWFVALAFAATPAWWTVRFALRRRGRRSSGGGVTAGRLRRRATTAVVAVSLALFVFFGIAWVRVSNWHDYEFEAGAGKTVFQIDSGDLKGSLNFSIDHPVRNIKGPESEPGWLIDWSRMWFAPEDRFHIPPLPDPLPRFRSEEIVGTDYSGGGGLFEAPGRGLFGAPVSKVTGRRWIVPYWFLLLLTAVLPALRGAWALRRRRRSKPGFCPGCGYDLRASPGRCPECGKAIDTSRDGTEVP